MEIIIVVSDLMIEITGIARFDRIQDLAKTSKIESF
jgi:hypothetical protein